MTSWEQLHSAWQRVAENKITVAQEEGLFDHLPGLGRPLEDIMDITDANGWARRAIRDCRQERRHMIAESSSERSSD